MYNSPEWSVKRPCGTKRTGSSVSWKALDSVNKSGSANTTLHFVECYTSLHIYSAGLWGHVTRDCLVSKAALSWHVEVYTVNLLWARQDSVLYCSWRLKITSITSWSVSTEPSLMSIWVLVDYFGLMGVVEVFWSLGALSVCMFGWSLLAFDSFTLDSLQRLRRHCVTCVAESEAGSSLDVCLPTWILSTCFYAKRTQVLGGFRSSNSGGTSSAELSGLSTLLKLFCRV